MSEIRNIPVFSDEDRQQIIGAAQVKSDEITITLKNEFLLDLVSELASVDLIRGFYLGISFLAADNRESR
jgi:phosphopantetheine adenylyltransferase